MTVAKLMVCALLIGTAAFVEAMPSTPAVSKRGLLHINVCTRGTDGAAAGCKAGWDGCCHRCCDLVRKDEMPVGADRKDWNETCECQIQLETPTPPSSPAPPPVTTPPPPPPAPPVTKPPPPPPAPAPTQPLPPLPIGMGYSVSAVELHGAPIPFSGTAPLNSTAYYLHNPDSATANVAYYVSGLTVVGAATVLSGTPPPGTLIYYIPNTPA